MKSDFMNPYNNPAMRDPQVQMQMFALFLTAMVALWVVNDARTRGVNAWSAFWWGFGTLMALIVVLPMWFILRPKLKNGAQLDSSDASNNLFPRVPIPGVQDAPSSTRSKICDHCGKFYIGQYAHCPHCGAPISTNN